MASSVLELPKDVCAPVQIGNLGALFKTTPSSDEVLASREERLIDSLIGALDKYLLGAISMGSVTDFRRERKKMWPKYVRALRALNDTFVNLVPEKIFLELSRQAFASIESDIQKQGPELWGSTLTDQSLFTLWTIGEIRALRREITSIEVSPPHQKKDSELASEYYLDSLWSQFHLDSLMAAMKFGRPVAEEIRAEVCDGLRASVNAYAIMKEAMALREPSLTEETPVANLPWGEEDERLLASSTRDMNVDFSSQDS